MSNNVISVFALFTVILTLCTLDLPGQEKLFIEGAITISNSESSNPDAGTIRWSGSDFEGWNGSNWVSLTGGACDGLTLVKDVEANTYRIVGIGSQCWMATNLRTTLYNDGTDIPNEPVSTDWGTLLTPAFCWYNDASANASPYGALYNWYAIDTATNGNKNVCPAGWHVPSEAEFAELINNLGGEDLAGIVMKEAGVVHFIDNNANASNLSGFTAIPGGYRIGTNFYEKNYYAHYWTTDESSPTSATFVDIEYDGDYARLSGGNKKLGYSIRCIKD